MEKRLQAMEEKLEYLVAEAKKEHLRKEKKRFVKQSLEAETLPSLTGADYVTRCVKAKLEAQWDAMEH